MTRAKLGHLPGYDVIEGRVFLTSPWVAATCGATITANGFTDRISLGPRVRSPGLRDARAVEVSYAAHGLSLATTAVFVDEASQILACGRRLIIGGARDGEIETLAACLIAIQEELCPRVAKHRLLRLAREAPRKVSGQPSPPMEPKLDEALLMGFAATRITSRLPASPNELLAHAESIALQPFLSDEGYLAAIESLDWLIGDPLIGKRAFALQVDLSRRLRVGSHMPWPASWAERRADWIHEEDHRPKTEEDLIADALAFHRPELMDEVAGRRPLTHGEHVIAASLWHTKAASVHDEHARLCHEKAHEHFSIAEDALAPEALQQWGRTLRDLARTGAAVHKAIEVLRRVPVGPLWVSTLDEIATATAQVRGDQDRDAFELTAEAAWYAALAEDDRVMAASRLASIAKDRRDPFAHEALMVLFHVATKTRHRRTLQRAIDASTSHPVFDEARHEPALLEALARSLAAACANLADKKDALFAAAGHAQAQIGEDPAAEKRAGRYRAEAQSLPGHPTCSMGVRQREW